MRIGYCERKWAIAKAHFAHAASSSLGSNTTAEDESAAKAEKKGRRREGALAPASLQLAIQYCGSYPPDCRLFWLSDMIMNENEK